jgi:hypothetical protein
VNPNEQNGYYHCSLLKVVAKPWLAIIVVVPGVQAGHALLVVTSENNF